MPQDQRVLVSCANAEGKFGISCSIAKKPNGEFRFKLASKDCGAYIRTEATRSSGWQKSHYHKKVRETYIVQTGQMILALWNDGYPVLDLYEENELITIKPDTPHNVYLSEGTIIHTVKHGNTMGKDWHKHPELDEYTSALKEKELIMNTRPPSKNAPLDLRYDSYVKIYNNLDNLIWRVPSFFVAVAAIFMAFLGSREAGSMPPLVWGGAFFFVGILFLIGTYSMYRLRLHHNRMGTELRSLEPNGYFHTRGETVQEKWPPSAPDVFMWVFSIIGLILLFLGVLMFGVSIIGPNAE